MNLIYYDRENFEPPKRNESTYYVGHDVEFHMRNRKYFKDSFDKVIRNTAIFSFIMIIVEYAIMKLLGITGDDIGVYRRLFIFISCMIIQLLYFIPGIYNGIGKIWGYEFFLRKSDVAKLSIYLVVFSFVHFLAWINISINSLGIAFAIYFWVAALIPEATRWGNMIDNLKVGETVKVIYKDDTDNLVINLRKTLFELCPNGVWYLNKKNRQVSGDCIHRVRIDKVVVTCDGKERYLKNTGGTWKLESDRNRWRYLVSNVIYFVNVTALFPFAILVLVGVVYELCNYNKALFGVICVGTVVYTIASFALICMIEPKEV